MTRSPRATRRIRLVALLSAATIGAACGLTAPTSTDPASTSPTASGPANRSPGGSATPSAASGLFDGSTVHDISISFDQAAYEAMIQAYTLSAVKNWIQATVTIDGKSYERVEIRLKGNSSLARLGGGGLGGGEDGLSKERPEALPWLVDLDRTVESQNHAGVVEFVVRSNDSATALNEAIALELLERAGLASQEAIAARFTVNGGKSALRLVIEHPDDVWMSRALSASGALYKAESTGDYSYRGDDPEAYDEVFDQEAGKANADLAPLIDFLEFLNSAGDATFAAEIAKRLDVAGFATYLAMQELLGNFDDIDGPGNNSYLYYDPASGRFTVVPWDHNLALGAGGDLDLAPGPGGGQGGNVIAPRPGESSQPGPGRPFPPPAPRASFAPPHGGPLEGPRGGVVVGPHAENVLSRRFLEIDEHKKLLEERKAELKAQLFDSGVAAQILADWAELLRAQASDLVDGATIDTEVQRVADRL
ncbi:MAG: CotH kinase family protein [Chloroflexi bacterium]|nr:CotH kinase family protein [Chloroflexota bacterium]